VSSFQRCTCPECGYTADTDRFPSTYGTKCSGCGDEEIGYRTQRHVQIRMLDENGEFLLHLCPTCLVGPNAGKALASCIGSRARPTPRNT